ncbi:hypothetical protein BH11PLA1_BH11PLA1_03630 [soil metagenome]
MLDLRSADAVIDAFTRGRDACTSSPLRQGCLEVIDPHNPAHAPARLIATGDLHDNPISFARLLNEAALATDGDADATSDAAPLAPPAHLTLHELIHPDTLCNGLDLSYRILARVAGLKARFPSRVHLLLANHELAQIVGAGIVKDGLNVVKAFNRGVEHIFGADAPAVLAALGAFIHALPLGLRILGAGDAGRDLLCLHSLPGPDLFDRFDETILGRALADDDLTPRRGSAHLLVWGRSQTPELIERLADAWNVGTFILGHEKADSGSLLLPPRAIVLNTDHAAGVFAPLDLTRTWSAAQIQTACLPIASQN